MIHELRKDLRSTILPNYGISGNSQGCLVPRFFKGCHSEIKRWPQQLHITEKQISKLFDPFQFCLIFLLCSIIFFRNCSLSTITQSFIDLYPPELELKMDNASPTSAFLFDLNIDSKSIRYSEQNYLIREILSFLSLSR